MNDTTVTGAQQVPGGNAEEQDPGGNAEDDIGEILATPKRVVELWNERKNIKEISELTGISLKDVSRILKSAQTRFVREEGRQP